MNDLIQAVIDNDEILVRAIVGKSPDLIFETGQSGRNALQIAQASGNIFCIVPILRKCRVLDQNEEQWKGYLLDYISNISEAYFCSQWEDGIERRLWSIVYDGQIDSILVLDDDTKSEIKWLVSKANSWPAWKAEGSIDWQIVDQGKF